MYKALSSAQQEELIDKVDLFNDPVNHKVLKVHKLTGRLNDRYSFSINYKTRVVFMFLPSKPREAFLLAVGDHDIYDR
jgi:mRNA-degrading endonuclease YafQ of YafQ-DinJ toxin-antitoxin module